ncbi:MAG: cytochrome c3 family protein, partial [Magnetococcales bacterium]|nr:cytochrome c3 family protein [Magnetococcales bacterium]
MKKVRKIFQAGAGLIFFLLLILPAKAGDPPSFQLSGSAAKADCGTCHAWKPTNPQRRELVRPHNTRQIRHGSGDLWCLDCHHSKQPGQLKDRQEETISFSDSWRLCAECHGRVVRNWRFGAHGKRVGSWQGERILLRCPACHDVHVPAWKPTPP